MHLAIPCPFIYIMILVVLLNGIPESEMSGSLIRMPSLDEFFCSWFIPFNFDVMAFFLSYCSVFSYTIIYFHYYSLEAFYFLMRNRIGLHLDCRRFREEVARVKEGNLIRLHYVRVKNLFSMKGKNEALQTGIEECSSLNTYSF